MSALIECRELGKSYLIAERELEVLHGIELRIDAGEYVAIMGPSGSGKSTLMNLLGCLDVPTRGTLRFGGRDLAEMSESERTHWRGEQVGFVFQSFNLMPRMSALANVQLPMRYRKAGMEAGRAEELLARVGLGERMGHRPEQLSGGERQRVAIARALVNRPSLILADEPTGNLDSASGEGIMGLMEELHGEGITVLLVTHDPAVGERARRRIALRDGRIVEDVTS